MAQRSLSPMSTNEPALLSETQLRRHHGSALVLTSARAATLQSFFIPSLGPQAIFAWPRLCLWLSALGASAGDRRLRPLAAALGRWIPDCAHRRQRERK